MRRAYRVQQQQSNADDGRGDASHLGSLCDCVGGACRV
jgi:hypothetical protein